MDQNPELLAEQTTSPLGCILSEYFTTTEMKQEYRILPHGTHVLK